MKASDLFIDCLENEGVKYIFGIPGEETVDMIGSLIDSKIKFLLTRHEQSAAFMADACGRLTGKAGVCLSTLGPGATNLMTGVADATLDRAPLVAITAQGGRERMHKESHQYIDLVKAFSPITKWNSSIRHAVAIPEVTRKAFRIAQVEKPGAAHIEFPEDVAKEEIGLKPLEITPDPVYYPNKEELKKAVTLIKNAKFPIILAGNGVVRARASDSLLKFAEANRIPVANTFMSKGVIPHDNDLSLFTIGLQLKDYVMCGFDRADVVIAIGYDFVEYGPYRWNREGNKRIIHIDSMRSEIDTYYNPQVELVGDIGITLNGLTEATGFNKSYSYTQKLRRIILGEFGADGGRDGSIPVKPQKIINAIRRVIRNDDILVSDVGMHKLWIARVFPTYKPNTVLISNGLAAMGFGLPAGIAAKLINKDKNVVVVSGDGGFMMNSQEIETAKRLGLNLTIVIFNDKKLGVIDLKQRNLKRQLGVNFNNPDFVKYAESFGAVGYRIENADDIEEILRDAVSSNNVAVVDVPIDYKENYRLLQRLGAAICPI